MRKLFATLESARTAEYIGEPISQLDHALQAAHWATRAGASNEQILAALFHDIGHLCLPVEQGLVASMAGFGVRDHESVGALFLREMGFPKMIQELVLGHVQAKRYLVTRHSRYQNKLSEASKQTLLFQGGPMSPEEADLFEKDVLFKEKLALREWDERAKIPGLEVPPLEAYWDLSSAIVNKALSSSRPSVNGFS